MLIVRLAEFPGGFDDFTMLEQRQEPQRDGAAGLAVSQHVSLAARLEIEIGELEAVERGRHRLQPFSHLGIFGQPSREQTQAGMLSASDTPTQLMELADAEAISVHHEHHRSVRHVDADLDDRRAHQYVDLTIAERGHHRVLVVRGQTAMHQPQPQTGKRPVPEMLEQLDHRRGRWPILAPLPSSDSSMRGATT